MTSDIQLEANRNNAQKSTGPATEAGKSAIRLNATRHGLTSQVACMTWEDRAAFNQFCAAIVTDFKPEGAIETQLAQSIAEDHWRLNRARAIEENLFALGFEDSTIDTDDPQSRAALSQAETFRDNLKSFNLITLYETRLNRNVQRNMDRLRQLQSDRREARANAPVLPSRDRKGAIAVKDQPARTHNGFVFSAAELAAVSKETALRRVAPDSEAACGIGGIPASNSVTQVATRYRDDRT
jgi:hypothetical protein